MNLKHETDTNSASSSVLFALLLLYYTPNIMSIETGEEAEFVSVSCFRFIWLQVSAGRNTEMSVNLQLTDWRVRHIDINFQLLVVGSLVNWKSHPITVKMSKLTTVAA